MQPTEGSAKLEWRTAQAELLDDLNKMIADFNKLVRRHNRLVAERYQRPVGRPLAASETQQADVLKRRKAGASLRAIGEATGLGLGTVRTILAAKKRGRDDRHRTFDRLRAARYRQRKRAMEALPTQVAQLQKAGAALIKEANGLGRDR